MTKHFIDVQDFSVEEVYDLFKLIKLLKDADKDNAIPPLFKGKSLAMIFEEPSTRTRISFEVAATDLGGHALYLKPGEIHLGHHENMSDTSNVLSRMCDVVMCRAWKHETVTELAEHASVPVINGLTDYNHPTQAICDVFTMIEHCGDIKDLNVVFIGDRTNVCSSTMHIVTQLGGNFTHIAPKKYESPKEWVDIAEANCKKSGGSVKVTDNIAEGLKGADVIYTDLWWWVDQEDEAAERKEAFMPDFQVTMDLLKKTGNPNVKFMHCLPASRGVEATDEVMDSKHSIIFDQAENRMHTERGLLVWLTSSYIQEPSESLKNYHRGLIENHINRVGFKSPKQVTPNSKYDL